MWAAASKNPLLFLISCCVLPSSAFIRMTCPQRLLAERVDPIVDPGKIGAHAYTVAGGNGFGFTMTYDQARSSTCSSCLVKEDSSNYWTPILYYKAQNGSFTMVPQDGVGDMNSNAMNVYYVQRPGPAQDKLHAFPAGLRMLAGDQTKRNFTNDNAAKAITFSCLDYSKPPPPYVNNIPNCNCPNGLQAQVYFPSCWDGKNLDSPDHQSHVAYPTEGYDSGDCPSTHPVHLVSMFYEVTWRTDYFKDQWYGSEHPFVFSQGDPTGYGFHGDFFNGWDVNKLQNAIDTCFDNAGNLQACSTLTAYSKEESERCTLPVTLQEDIQGPLPALPGCNPVSLGPEPANEVKPCPADATCETTGPMEGPIKSGEDVHNASPEPGALPPTPENPSSTSTTPELVTSGALGAYGAGPGVGSSTLSTALTSTASELVTSGALGAYGAGDEVQQSTSSPSPVGPSTPSTTSELVTSGRLGAYGNGDDVEPSTSAVPDSTPTSDAPIIVTVTQVVEVTASADSNTDSSANTYGNSDPQPLSSDLNKREAAPKPDSQPGPRSEPCNHNMIHQHFHRKRDATTVDEDEDSEGIETPHVKRFAPWHHQPRLMRSGGIKRRISYEDMALQFPEVIERGVVGSNLGYDPNAMTYVEDAIRPEDEGVEGGGQEQGQGQGEQVQLQQQEQPQG